MERSNSIKAFDKVQDLQRESTNWQDRSPFDTFKELIRDKDWGSRELHMIGEALLVFGNYDKERVQTYLNTLDELGLPE